ncbi:MAG: hypothetical protein QM774_07620 [Gordonia sp. (in: high G+C Gram-positive bacteria)]|uniref:hypothetical protein n=1 Tax=Gordonia sp. (in: high G+C Gram-positive bacteria) TaxID=84139 RepID=UPI0039E3B967
MNAVNLAGAVAFLADDTQGPEFGKASPIGLLVIIVLLVAVFLLIRSMNKQLRKLPESFDTDNPEPDQAFDEGTILTGDDDSDGDVAEDEPDLAEQSEDRGSAGK